MSHGITVIGSSVGHPQPCTSVPRPRYCRERKREPWPPFRSPDLGAVRRSPWPIRRCENDIGVLVQGNAAQLCGTRVPQVAGRLRVVPRPADRRCRSASAGRGQERPALLREGVLSAASRRRRTRSPTGWPSSCTASPRKPGTVSVADSGLRMRLPHSALESLPAKDGWTGATSRGGWHGVSMPILLCGTPGAMGRGSLRPRSPAPARHGRSSGRGVTESRPTIWRTGGLSVGDEISCPVAPDVERTLPLGPEQHRIHPSDRLGRACPYAGQEACRVRSFRCADRAVHQFGGNERWHARNEVGALTALPNGAALYHDSDVPWEIEAAARETLEESIG